MRKKVIKNIIRVNIMKKQNNAAEKSESKFCFHEGLKLQRSGLIKEAIEYYKKSLRLDPDNFDANNIFGIIEINKNNYNQAIKYLNKALQINNKSSHALNNLGIAFYKIKKISEAIDCYKKSINIGI